MKSWWKRERVSAPILVALAALLGAAAMASWGLYAHRTEMKFNLLAELAGVLFEIAVVVLVVDWMVAQRERSRWRHACPMIPDRFATVFTDVMRLLYVAATKDAGYIDAARRYPEFHIRLSRNLDHLRSTVEGFAVVLESSAHYAIRDLELKMRWLHDRLEFPPETLEREFQVSLETAKEFDRFCAETWGRDYGRLKTSVVAIVGRVAPQVVSRSSPIDRNQALNLRYQLQDSVLDSEFGTERPLGILFDYRQVASVHYFLIYLLLLPHHVTIGTVPNPRLQRTG